MFEIGDIVRVKEEQSGFIKYVYDTQSWTPMKRELGIKAAEGIPLVVTLHNRSGIEVTDAEHRYRATLNLEAKYFEKIKKEEEVDEGAMFALL